MGALTSLIGHQYLTGESQHLAEVTDDLSNRTGTLSLTAAAGVFVVACLAALDASQITPLFSTGSRLPVSIAHSLTATTM